MLTAMTDGERFRVPRLHARGGLGDAFVAIDAELHRELALKQTLDDLADHPRSRAPSGSGRDHRRPGATGIVPVYGRGVYADGRPYYAMRFIRGEQGCHAGFHSDQAVDAQFFREQAPSSFWTGQASTSWLNASIGQKLRHRSAVALQGSQSGTVSPRASSNSRCAAGCSTARTCARNRFTPSVGRESTTDRKIAFVT